MLYIIRHGKTDWNELHKLQGRTDVSLNEEGRRQAEKERDEIKDVRFDLCFCSPLKRAKETAEILLSGRDIPIIYDERLIEMSFGIFEGVENSFGILDCPVNVLFKNPELYVKPVEKGESLDELFIRTGDFLKNEIYPRLEKDLDILIVGHGAMNSSIISQVKHLERKDFWSNGIPNCKLVRLI